MLEVHAPHQTIHTWKDFLIHIATIAIGLLIAIGLERIVEVLHHRHQAHEALDLLKQEGEENRVALKEDIRTGEIQQRQHRADLGVLRRLRTATLRPDDRLVFVRPYERLSSSVWKIVRESGAADYIPYELMAQYGEIYATQQEINEAASSAYVELQKATSVLNTDQEDQNRNDEDRVERNAVESETHSKLLASTSDQTLDDVMSRLSGNHDLSQLTPGQVDRLEQGFQQAITDDRRLHRMYIYLDTLYAKLAK